MYDLLNPYSTFYLLFLHFPIFFRYNLSPFGILVCLHQFRLPLYFFYSENIPINILEFNKKQ
jgi:hypothetical protein